MSNFLVNARLPWSFRFQVRETERWTVYSLLPVERFPWLNVKATIEGHFMAYAKLTPVSLPISKVWIYRLLFVCFLLCVCTWQTEAWNTKSRVTDHWPDHYWQLTLCSSLGASSGWCRLVACRTRAVFKILASAGVEDVIMKWPLVSDENLTTIASAARDILLRRAKFNMCHRLRDLHHCYLALVCHPTANIWCDLTRYKIWGL